MNLITGVISIMRNYDNEIKDNKTKYAYNFDYDVMHPFMLKTFQPHFKPGSLLELGSFEGKFTKILLPFFSNIFCVEASKEAINKAKILIGDKAKFYNFNFENFNFNRKANNIILSHVLEHLDNPVALLKKIRKDWLSRNGYLFLTVPNANAPSRQIAVKMGLIETNSTVTKSEFDHGHRITYTFDRLELDVKKAGLEIVYRSGIFFKALANFQWDRLLQTNIISDEYIEGCYQLGQQYPDLCSSIFLLCQKGR